MRQKESPKAFNPNIGQTTGKTGRVYRGKATQGHCREHGWYKTCLGGGKTNWCEKCGEDPAPNGMHVITGDAYAGWYEHITTTPLWISNKKELYHACMKHGKTARALMSGGEMKRPKGA